MKINILVVDDEKLANDLFVEVLTRAGYEVESVFSAEDALVRLNDKTYDLMLSDIRMKNMDGIVPFTIDLSGDYLKFGENMMKVIVSYEDEKGNKYLSQEDFTITLGDTTFMQKIQVLLNQFSLWIDRMINN